MVDELAFGERQSQNQAVQLAIVCDHRRWLQLLADEWWVPATEESGFWLGINQPYKVECGDRIPVVMWIDSRRLPDFEVPINCDDEWRSGMLAEASLRDEGVYWAAPIPLTAIAEFSVATEAERTRLAAMSKGFANLADFDQPLIVKHVAFRETSARHPGVNALRPPAVWNALRGAAAMAVWSVPSTPPWLSTLCRAFASRRILESNAACAWWNEPPWVEAGARTETDSRDLALWRAMIDTFTVHRIREGWNRRDLLGEIIGKAAAEFGGRELFAALEEDTALLLGDQKVIDIADGDRDPLGMALQLVLLRPTADRFETWKTDLPGMQPAVWMTAAALAGLITGYRDLEPRFTGLPEGRYWLALRTWRMQSSSQPALVWPWYDDEDPVWSAEDASLSIRAGGTLLAQRRQNSRGRWYLSDLKDRHVRDAALALVQARQPSLAHPVIRIADGALSWSGEGSVRISNRRIVVKGAITLALSDSLTLNHDIDEEGFKHWISHASIAKQLPDPPQPQTLAPMSQRIMAPRQASLLAEHEDSNVPGLLCVPEFITADEERQLIEAVDRAVWLDDLSRRVQHYGWRYDYKARKLSPGGYLGPLPAWAMPLATRLVAAGLTEEMPDQVIVNEYIGKQGIAAHVDCESCFRGAIVTISLLESWEMIFSHRVSKNKTSVVLERGSAIVMQGEARHEWTHEIRKRLNEKWGKRGRRVSLTFRKANIAGVSEKS
ncbi:hypothetical protein GCM10007388_00650 [Pseudoduganella plicata]|uniref:Fe2OG dioxygenase domain-containing protein n=1 Tax=Pseudoduganella plicata TaxID=321984 RepID=A0AA88C658_9BURK|nr:hypothetical protein GCM10007388_00650 [Pseudoduganella plicata]